MSDGGKGRTLDVSAGASNPQINTPTCNLRNAEDQRGKVFLSFEDDALLIR